VGKLAGNGPELWMNMQSKYNLWKAQQNRENQKILAGVPTLKDLEFTLEG